MEETKRLKDYFDNRFRFRFSSIDTISFYLLAGKVYNCDWSAWFAI